MARLVAVVLLLTLVMAPGVSAEPPNRGEAPSYGWLVAFWSFLDQVLAWVPTFRSEPRRNGAFIEPSGIIMPPPGSRAAVDRGGFRAEPRKNGAFIEPSGLRFVPDFLASPRPGHRAGFLLRD